MGDHIIKGNFKFKRPKLTVEEKALKKVVTSMTKVVTKQIKSDAPRLTGALKFSIGSKVLSKNARAYSIIGVKSRYGKTVKGKLKIPNLYAYKVEQIHRYLSKNINANLVSQLRAEVKRTAVELVKGS